MHQVVASYLKQFSIENGILELDEAKRFERFVNYCVVAQFNPNLFDVESLTTSDSDPSIDGIAVILGDDVVTTSEDARSLLSTIGTRRSIEAHYIFCQAKRTDGFDAGDMLKFGVGTRALFDGPPRTQDDVVDEFLEVHGVLLDSLSKIHHGRPKISLFYATTGTWNETSGLREQVTAPTVKLLEDLGLFHSVEFLPIDRERLIKLWNRTKEPVQASFSVKGTVALPTIGKVTEAYLSLVRADEFVANVLADKDGRIRASVFEQNVRAFLGEENDVNRRMKAALADPDRHDRFVINNNGVTIVAPDVRVQNDRVSVTDYQIVNGCQTSHVLFRNRELLTDKIWVSVKVIEAQDSDVVGQLVESTNSQSIVEESQFMSIRPFAQRLEAYFAAIPGSEDESDQRLYFERRTNQYADSGVSRLRVFDIAKLARAFASMFLDLPHLAYMYPTQVLRERASHLFRPEHSEHAYYTAALALYRLELALGNEYVPRKYQGFKWHMLMLLRQTLAQGEMPRLDSAKIGKYLGPLDAALAKGGKASAPPFLACAAILDKAGGVSRNQRKGAPYTEALRRATAANVKGQKPQAAPPKAKAKR